MTAYYIDLLEPDKDLDIALDNLGRLVGSLYKEAWETYKRKLYSDKPFQLNINLFANMWFRKDMKIFIVYDSQTHESLGFLTGMAFRPMPYDAQVFQVQEWFTRGNEQMEQDLFNHVMSSIRILGCDEVWIQGYKDRKTPDLGLLWKFSDEHPVKRYVRKE